MRLSRIKALAIALTGTALFASEAAQAGLPSDCSICASQPVSSRIRGPHKHSGKKKTGHVCANCAARMQAEGMTPPPMMAASAPGGCAACGTASSTITPAMPPSAPGYAMVGDGVASPSPLLAAGGNAPGYAIVGGTMVSSEPAPIGVMQTNYQTDMQPQGTLGASVAPNRPAAPGMANVPFAKPAEVPPGLYAPQRRSSVLARMIGLPSLGRRRAEAEANQRESHARTSYGANNGPPTDLPGSMVYGSR